MLQCNLQNSPLDLKQLTQTNATKHHNHHYTIDVINKVDLVVVFRGIVNKYEKSCQTGQWNSPFCRQTQLSNQLIADMKTAADFEPSKFVSMIFKVKSADLSGLIEKHFQGDFPGGIFVSDKLTRERVRPE